ncbi:hypothetical protein ACWEWX_52370, partial [Streptomyces asiaticus]
WVRSRRPGRWRRSSSSRFPRLPVAVAQYGTIDGRDTTDAYRYLADRGVDAPSGSFYAVEASRRLGLGDTGGLRIGLAPYTSTEDVDRLLEALSDFLRTPAPRG